MFGIANVGGSSGCNTYDGTYGTNGTIVRIGRLATTRKDLRRRRHDPGDGLPRGARGRRDRRAARCGARAPRQERRRDRRDDQAASRGRGVGRTEPDGKADRHADPDADRDANGDADARSRPRAPARNATPTASPTATATTKPTLAPTPAPTPAPTLQPPPSVPPESTCTVTSPSGVQLASIVYPASWHTRVRAARGEPAATSTRTRSACRRTAAPRTRRSRVKPDVASYDDAVAAATDPANWNVVQSVETTVSGLQATLVEATSTTADSGTPVGTTLYSYIIDYGDGGR